MTEKALLLEIGTEEIPARFLPEALDKLKHGIIQELLIKKNIPDPESYPIRTYATPRRLAAIVEGLPDTQPDRDVEVLGPPRHAAYDKDGKPTKAAIGFARKTGVNVEALVIKSDAAGKGEYVCALIKEKGRPVIEVLPEALKSLVLSLHFPKSMRWGEGSLRFVRPIHWIAALYGDRTVEFEMDGIKSGNSTRGHRFLSPAPIEIKDINKFEELLEKNFVIIGAEKRKEMINVQALELSGSGIEDEELLETVSYLVEYPQAVLAGFSEEYLRLPPELIVSVLKGHQKYFALKDGNGNLTNKFIVVGNTKKENAAAVRAGAERVIRARLEDARFYFEEDKKKRLSDRADDLKRVTYQERLGSLYDKTARVKAVAEHIAGKIKPELKKIAGRAALLSKTDLITGVVKEFPELQGIMGSYYAAIDGESGDVARALRDQYHPAYQGDPYELTDAGAALSLADKFDNLASFFSIGLTPTGSEDPFALRRQALGIIAILLDKGFNPTIADSVRAALKNLGHIPEAQKAEPELIKFFEQRLRPLFEGRGYEFDLIEAVIGFSTAVPLREVVKRLEALREFKTRPGYNEFLTAVKRVRNIIPPRELPPLKEELLKLDEERALNETAGSVGAAMNKLIKESSYAPALESLFALTSPINKFFDKVLVMDKDEAVRDNRLGLLKSVWELASKAADFSRLQEI